MEGKRPCGASSHACAKDYQAWLALQNREDRPAAPTSPRELRWLLSKREEELTSEEKSDLTRLLEVSQEVKQVYQLLQSFLHMLRERQPERLNGMDEGSM